jgi:acetolactate decarboxylase
MNYDGVKDAIDDVLPTTNIFYAIKITGSFPSMQTRSVAKQEKPYRELIEVVREQSVFDFENVEGTIVALRAPGYVADINVPGYHFHFLTQDKSGGGHVLDFTAENITIEIDYTFGFEMILPNAADFFAASLVSGDLDEVEKPKSNLRAYDFFK